MHLLDENISHCAPQGSSLCTGKSSVLPCGFLINYCTLVNIFSTQLWFYHTHIQTHITEGSTFISELFLYYQEFGYLSNLKYLNEWQKLTLEKMFHSPL